MRRTDPDGEGRATAKMNQGGMFVYLITTDGPGIQGKEHM